MNKDYNSMAFTPEEVEKGLHLDLIKYLLDYNTKAEDYFNDIHITSDGYCTIIEWDHLPNDRSYGGRFEYVNEDQYVMEEIRFPDKHYEMVYPQEVEEAWARWKEENPDWYQSGEFNTWHNRKEDEAWAKMLEEEKNRQQELEPLDYAD